MGKKKKTVKIKLFVFWGVSIFILLETYLKWQVSECLRAEWKTFQSPTLTVQLNDLATAVHRVELSRKLLLVPCAVSDVLLIGIKNTYRAVPRLLSCLDAFLSLKSLG